MTVPVPDAALRLRDCLHDAGWSYIVQRGRDTGGAPYVVIRGLPPDDPDTEVRATWHTRDTGTYRLFHCMLAEPGRGWRDLSLTSVLAVITNRPCPWSPGRHHDDRP